MTSEWKAKKPSSIFVVGYPGEVGGANTECWHTIKLWRRFGLRVRLIPTWRAEPAWKTRLDSLGCETIEVAPEALDRVEGLPGSVVVAMCNQHFLAAASRFRRLGCRVVWLNCMTWLFPEETAHYRRFGPFDAYVFQSDYQRDCLQPKLARHGVRAEQCRLIHGAFDCEEFPFQPRWHRPDTPFVLGRLSRAATDKFSRRTWSIYASVPYPIRARVMAWDDSVQRSVGTPPDWADCLPGNAQAVPEFLGRLHCMTQVNGTAGENWPRSGLEAMAAGVPLVAENRWGWQEMVSDGETGFLWDAPDEFAVQVDRLARDEELRMNMARRARRMLEEELANPDVIWGKWRQLFSTLAD